MATPYFVADSASVTVLRSVASTVYGSYNLSVPDGVSIDDIYQLQAPGNSLGYVSSLGDGSKRVGGFFRRFMRADVSVTAADAANPDWVPSSDVERVLDEAEKRVTGDFFLETDITRAGLGPWREFVDFQVGDWANVEIWGMVVQLAITRIEPFSSDFDSNDVKVHLGGQVVEDSSARLVENEGLRQALIKDQRDLAGLQEQVAKAVQSVDKVTASMNFIKADLEQISKIGVGLKSTTVSYAVFASGTVAPKSGWQASPPAAVPGQFVWTRTVWEYTDNSTETGYSVGKIGETGATGEDGVPGKDGTTLVSTTITYAASASGTKAPSSGWQASPPSAIPGQFVWTRSVWEYSDGTTETGYSVGKIGDTGAQGPKGDKGDPGADGVPGKNGLGVKSTTITYAAAASGTTAPLSGWTAQPPAASPGQFVWTRMVLAYTDGATETVYSVGKIGDTGARGATGASGKDGLPGKDGVGLKSTVVTYAVSTSGTKAPSSGWQASPPVAKGGQYMWTRFIWTYTDNTTETGYSIGKIGDVGSKGDTGAQGPKGATGAAGVSVKTVTRFWRWSATKPGTPTGTANPSGWSTTQPAYVVGQKLWTTVRTVLSNNTATWSPVTEEATVSAATAIAQASADGKNRIWYSATAPGSSKGEQAGDTWFRYSGAKIIGQWRWTGGAWQAQTIDNQVIANLDAGKITSGTIDAQRIAANSISAQKLQITPGNLFPDPHFQDSCWSVRYSTGYGGSLELTGQGAQSGLYYQPSGVTKDTALKVEPGAVYRLTTHARFGGTGGVTFVSVYCRYVNSAGETKIHKVGQIPRESQVSYKIGTVSTNITFPSDMKSGECTIGFFVERSHPDGSVSLWDVQLVRAADASLIVDGAIQGRHIQANSINGDRIAAGTLDAKAIRAGTLSADAISSGTISVDRIDAEQVFLSGGEKPLESKHEELQSLIEDSTESLWDANEEIWKALEPRVGMAFVDSNSQIVGSGNASRLFKVNTANSIVTASGSWTGKVVVFASSDEVSVLPITKNNRTASFSDYPFLFYVDASSTTTTTLNVASNTQFAQSKWVTISGMSTTAPNNSMRATISGQVCFTNVHRGSTYGVRLLVGGEVKDTWTSTTFGPLGPLGNPNWYHKFAWEGLVESGQKIEVQVYCSNGTASKRTVRKEDTSVSVEIKQM